MNIKLLTPNPIPTIEPKARVEGSPRLQDTADRDADGRRERDQQPQKERLNQQEFDDALKVLGETPGLKANGLLIKVVDESGTRVVLITAPDGQIVRRLTEAQLWAMTRDKDRPTGKILDKKM